MPGGLRPSVAPRLVSLDQRGARERPERARLFNKPGRQKVTCLSPGRGGLKLPRRYRLLDHGLETCEIVSEVRCAVTVRRHRHTNSPLHQPWDLEHAEGLAHKSACGVFSQAQSPLHRVGVRPAWNGSPYHFVWLVHGDYLVEACPSQTTAAVAAAESGAGCRGIRSTNPRTASALTAPFTHARHVSDDAPHSARWGGDGDARFAFSAHDWRSLLDVRHAEAPRHRASLRRLLASETSKL